MTEKQIVATLGVKVMGWSKEQVEFLYPAWNPLQNIADAMQVVESFEQYCLERIGSSRMCEIFIHDEVYRGQGATMTEAICHAAIKAAA
ncbi:BC1872 family protein [Brevibacillus porteri]|uniref:BC1872 family protein n=1 Tax=Brevibacillus porteri TaxID=2126350 RepID=UPI003D1B5C57